ncbi:helicase, partial [Candidatus Parcubacteria bacterium]
MSSFEIKKNSIIRGPFFDEPVQVIDAASMGSSLKLYGKGLNTGRVHDLILSAEQIALLQIAPDTEPFDGDARKFRLGVEAMRLGLAYEYDPYFSLSIARIDPLPHQLEAVYDYFLKLPRIRFLLADDPGAGKTIMAGLLIKELKIRGLVKRILIIAPANLTFQWQREMQDKFRETFKVMKGDVLRANYGMNPWQEEDQVVTSISWVSRIEDAKASLLRSRWDLIIVDEAHKMSAYSPDRATLAYRLGQSLSEMTDHYLLMTATPHKGDVENFRLFLELLDRDVYADIRSLEEAMRRHEAPFYLRRVKEALVSFPDAETGEVRQLFTKRHVKTVSFRLSREEYEFYESLTRYVEEQSMAASENETAIGRAIGFTMAMLQRRFASSVFAVRRSLERMKDRREKILADPEAYRQERIARKLPDDFDELTEQEQQEILDELDALVASVDPAALRHEIAELQRLIDQARQLEAGEVETKLAKLKEVITQHGLFDDPKMKLLIFTEHKDTLDYLVRKLEEWGLSVTQIHGGMKIGDRDTPGTRIFAEREFRESCQVMVATEAAGEGINLQFCWLMINYDIPWNPVRLEQRMGRIHRYGQEKDCLIINFVAVNTREGRVMDKLFERIRQIEEDLDPKKTGTVFNVLGDVFPSNMLERMLRDMYARNIEEKDIKARIVENVDKSRFEKITNSALEGLAKRELNLSAIIGKSAEAKERRLVPEVIQEFFLGASQHCGLNLKPAGKVPGVFRIGRVPRVLYGIGERLEPRFGRLGKEYKRIVFDKDRLSEDPTLEWVTPGHPLFESVREYILAESRHEMERGAIFYDINLKLPVRLDVYRASIKDGRGNVLHQRLFVAETDVDGNIGIRQPTLFLDLVPAEPGESVPSGAELPGKDAVEQILVEQALMPLLAEVEESRAKEIEMISHHLEASLSEIINRENLKQAELLQRQMAGSSPGIDAAIRNVEDRIDELNHRLERRRAELALEKHCSIADVQHLGRVWVLPHPERTSAEIAPMVRDEEIERIAVKTAIAYENARGWEVKSVENENRG